MRLLPSRRRPLSSLVTLLGEYPAGTWRYLFGHRRFGVIVVGWQKETEQ